MNVLLVFSGLKHKLKRAHELAHENFKQSHIKMKHWYDKDVRIIECYPGEKVLALLLISGHPLPAKYFAPYVIECRLN